MLPVLFLLVQPPVELKLDATEAEACIRALESKKPGMEAIVSTEAYKRLEQREASLHRTFTQADFQKWLLSTDLSKDTPALRAALQAWKSQQLEPLARQALQYLPAGARVRATVYIVLKPRDNSFVFESTTNPAIFLYLDPRQSPAQFANTVTHELHHIGFAGNATPNVDKLDPRTRKAAEWAGAFGEGFAMLAAAGGPAVHPHASSPAADRERWDRDMTSFAADRLAVENFLMDILDEELETDEEIRERGQEFFGVQGPWYTVGYKMAALIEAKKGRAELIACMTDPGRLLRTYNELAPAEALPKWSAELVGALTAP